MVNHKALQLAFRARLLTLSGLPDDRAWENTQFTPRVGHPYIEEEYLPAPGTLRGFTQGGVAEDTGMYVVRWYGLANTDLAIVDDVHALLALFPPGLALTTTAGDTAHVRGDVMPSRSPLRADGPDWIVCTVTIPFRCYTLTPVS
jgi:hypothetical protein